MLTRFPFVLLTATILLPASAASAGSCEQLQMLVPASACAENRSGIAVAEDKARATQLLEYAEGGRSRFEQAFGAPAPRYAIIESENGELSDELRDAIRADGTKALLPWLSPSGQQAQTEHAVRRAVEQRMAQSGLDEQARKAAVESAIAQLRARNAPDAARERDSIAIPHELAHIWLINRFWPNASGAKPDQYGGPGPDWLDEMAAVIAEPEDSKRRRRALFWERYAGDGRAELTDLRQFLASDHPLASQARQLSAAAREKQSATATTVTVLSGEAARDVAGSGISFYLRSLMFSDYLADTSGDVTVFCSIAKAISSGMTFEDWLGRDGERHGLAGSIDDLQADWLRWLDQKRPAPAAPAS
jgi:hypothetical protein